MFVIKKMRLNKFQPRPIVSNRALFLSNGEKPAVIQSKATADCYSDPSVEGASKTKMLGLAKEITVNAAKFANGDDPQQLSKDAKDL